MVASPSSVDRRPISLRARSPTSEPSRRIDRYAASSRRTSVVIEEPAEPLTTANPMAALARRTVDEFAAQPLVIP